ncbi:MAG: FKBP-type peptidyl-prolyl cis-trans isomerase FkpA [Saprospiraceae bacterium]|jgi:FKBP-type peptidyl-prolyl cis-trans isomerase FkpA
MQIINYTSFLFFLICCIAISSCGSDETESSNEGIQAFILSSNTSFQESSSGLYYNITEEGITPFPSSTSFVVFDLKGQLLSGTSVGNTFGSEADVRIDLNQNIIPGLKEALEFLGTGGEGTFILPSDLAFGTIGNGVIPANAPIVYQIEMLGIYADEMVFSDALLSEYIENQGFEDVTQTASGLYVIIEEPGSDITPSSSQGVTVHYEGYFLNGDVFDSSIARGAPSTFSLNQVIAGWTEGIPYFGEGGKGKLLIPAHLAYGASGNQNIPAYTPILFDIELISVN